MFEVDPTLTSCNHVEHSGPGWEICPRCGSTCSRDKAGHIITYTRGTLDMPERAGAVAAAGG